MFQRLLKLFGRLFKIAFILWVLTALAVGGVVAYDYSQNGMEGVKDRARMTYRMVLPYKVALEDYYVRRIELPRDPNWTCTEYRDDRICDAGAAEAKQQEILAQTGAARCEDIPSTADRLMCLHARWMVDEF